MGRETISFPLNIKCSSLSVDLTEWESLICCRYHKGLDREAWANTAYHDQTTVWYPYQASLTNRTEVRLWFDAQIRRLSDFPHTVPCGLVSSAPWLIRNSRTSVNPSLHTSSTRLIPPAPSLVTTSGTYGTSCRACSRASLSPWWRAILMASIWKSYTWAMSWENLFMQYVNNKGADQPMQPCSLISTYVVCCLDSMISLVSILAISWL